ncbi:AEC family transporter [Acidocella sp.]|uniref:AEC family transporter n=1 Tax=Acidocella sp. TaxID=50710 RepID=UPI0026027BED|nr:AEC family transporter [Acidocella sp.]
MGERIIAVLFPLFAVVALGYVVGRKARPDFTAANRLNVEIFTPALVFSALCGKDVQVLSYVPLAVGTLLVVVGSGVGAFLLARMLRMDPKTLIPPMMFNNCGNLGLPVAVLAFGQHALAAGVITFAVSNFLQFSFGIWLLDHKVSLRSVWRVPSVMATLAGLFFAISGIAVWPPLLYAVTMLGNVAIPLMLMALGVRLALSHPRAIAYGLLGAVARPVLGMAMAAGAILLLPLPHEQKGLLLVFGALPPAVLNYIFAERYNQEPDKVASMVLIGNLAALVFLPIALGLAL